MKKRITLTSLRYGFLQGNLLFHATASSPVCNGRHARP
jgi:hypothetical protein